MRFCIVQDRQAKTNPIAVLLHDGSRVFVRTTSQYAGIFRNLLGTDPLSIHTTEGATVHRELVPFGNMRYLDAVKGAIPFPLSIKYMGTINNADPLTTLTKRFLPESLTSVNTLEILPRKEGKS